MKAILMINDTWSDNFGNVESNKNTISERG